ncbi:MAG: hypothetical protein RLO81_06540 [Fulvivirga sp.]
MGNPSHPGIISHGVVGPWFFSQDDVIQECNVHLIAGFFDLFCQKEVCIQ